jgi:predicted SprT family Zn-dependent metalloprotease
MATTKKNIVTELERVFDSFNKILFEGKLLPVTIEIQPKKKFFLRWSVDSESIVLGSEFSNIEYSEVFGLMLHEMVHVANHQRGLTDATTNQYHNSRFLRVALSVGLVVIRHKTQGWSITTTMYPRNVVDKVYIKRPNKDAVNLRNAAFDSVVLDEFIFRAAIQDIRDRTKKDRPAKTFFLKYQCNCPPPHNSIRSGRRPDGPNAPNIFCQDCRSEFVCVEENENFTMK